MKQRDDVTLILDVWENEPRFSPELLEKVFIASPHVAGYSLEGKLNGTKIVYDALCDWMRWKKEWIPDLPLVEEDEVQFLDQYLTLEKLRFKNKLIYSINVDPKISGLDILIPSLLVQPFVENSIKYGQKNSDHILNISIEFKIVSNHILSISILDNGPGINFENPNNTLGDLGKVESIGINLSRQRINNHNRTLNINGLKIESVQNEENAITGTKVEILLMTN